MAKRFALGCCGLVLLLGWSSAAGVRAESAPRTAPFWQAAHDPHVLRAEALVRQARALLYPALGGGSLLSSLGQARRVAIEAALARLSLARRMDPGNVEALYLTGMALSQWEGRDASGALRRQDERAVDTLRRLQALAPDYAPYEVSFELAILYTRLQRFDDARRAWHHALSVQLGEPSVPTVYANLAEVTMMAGDLAEAAELYQRAVEQGDGEARILPMWGLAVVLDRLGEPGEALLWARRAIDEDERPMAVLRAPGVFFVPPYELHYYTALGELAQASEARGRVADECERPVPAEPALRGASREGLQFVVRLSTRLAELAPKLTGPETLAHAARTRLTERNRIARREGEIVSESSRETRALVATLAALHDFRRYLAEGGRDGPFADQAERRSERLSRCLGFHREQATARAAETRGR